MNNYKVKKAKLIDRLFLEVELEEVITTTEGQETKTHTNDLKKMCRMAVHPDMLAAFDALTPHLPHLCEITEDKELLEPENEKLKSFQVTGFTLGGSDEHAGVTVIGRKTLSNKKVLNLVAPFTKWEEEHLDTYKFSSDLYDAIGHAEYEVMEYVFNGKVKPSEQLELQLAS